MKYDETKLRILEIHEVERNRLTGSEKRLPATKIAWESSAEIRYDNGRFEAEAEYQYFRCVREDSCENSTRYLDVNNDGSEELVRFHAYYQAEYGYVALQVKIPSISGNTNDIYDLRFKTQNYDGRERRLERIITTDLNGDGIPDIITQDASLLSYSNEDHEILFKRINNVVRPHTDDPPNRSVKVVDLQSPISIAGTTEVIDIDGDHKDEFVVVPKNGKGIQIFAFENNEFHAITKPFDQTTRIRKSDLNADGLQDLIFLGDTEISYITQDKTSFLKTLSYPASVTSKEALSFIDVNGDGYGDLIHKKSGEKIKVWLNYGDRFQNEDIEMDLKQEFGKSITVIGNFTNSGYQQALHLDGYDTTYGSKTYRVYDLHVIKTAPSKVEIVLAEPKSRLTVDAQLMQDYYDVVVGKKDEKIDFRDINFDGVSEIVKTIDNAKSGQNGRAVYYADIPVQDKVKGVIDGFGNKVLVEYAGLFNKDKSRQISAGPPAYNFTNRSLKAKYNYLWTTYPVVKSLKYSNGLGPDGLNTVQYQYSDLVSETTGRGIAGFRTVSKIDDSNGIKIETEYDYEFPFSGKILSEKRTSKSGIVVFEQRNSWKLKLFEDLGRELAKNENLAVTEQLRRSLDLSGEKVTWSAETNETFQNANNLMAKAISLNLPFDIQTIQRDNPRLGSGNRFDNPNSIYKAVGRYNLFKTTYMPILAESVVIKRELDNEIVSKSRIKYTVDSFGNIPRTETDFHDDSRLVYEREFLNLIAELNENDVFMLGLPKTEKTVVIGADDTTSNPRTIHNEFDRRGNLSKSTRQRSTPHELTTEYAYDNFGNISKKKMHGNKGDAITEEYIPSPDGRFLAKHINPLGHETSFQIDGFFGSLKSETDANGLEIKYDHDEFGNLVRQTFPDQRSITYDFEFLDDVQQSRKYRIKINQGGAKEITEYYDQMGRNIHSVAGSIDEPCRTEDTSSPIFERQIQSTIDFDARGKVVKVIDPYYRWSLRAAEPNETYRHCGDIGVNPTGRNGGYIPRPTTTIYDTVGRPTRVNFNSPDTFSEISYSTTSTLDPRRRSTSIKRERDIRGQEKLTYYNAKGEIARVYDNARNAITYHYDLWGNVVRIDQPNGNSIGIEYDAIGRKTKLVDPAIGTVQYKYDEFDRLILETTIGQNQKQKHVALEYDKLNRLTKRTTNDGVTGWEYDSDIKGKLSKVMDSNGYNRQIEYDKVARPITETQFIGKDSYEVGYTYDVLSRLKKKTFDSEYTVEFDYVNNFPVAVSQIAIDGSKALLAKIDDLSADGRIARKSFGNGLTTSYSYSMENGLVESIETRKNPKVGHFFGEELAKPNPSNTVNSDLSTPDMKIQDLRFEYDSGYNIVSKKDLINNTGEYYSYDNLNRLSATTIAGNQGQMKIRMLYDSDGRISSKSDLGAYGYDTAFTQRVKHISNLGSITHSFEYDDFGNLNRDRISGLAMEYTSFNKPKRISKDGLHQDIKYDFDNREIESSTTDATGIKRITQKPFPNYEVVTEGRVRKTLFYISLGGELVAIHSKVGGSESNHYIHKNHLGSVQLITDERGQNIREYVYSDFGERKTIKNESGSLASESGTRKGFTGHEHQEEFGLINASGRYYLPEIGRFASADPFAESPSDLRGLDRYSYVQNNPHNFVDPSGYWGITIRWGKPLQAPGRAVSNLGRGVGRAATDIYNEHDRFADKYGKQIVIVAAAVAITVASGGAASGLVAPMLYGALTSVAINAAVVTYNGGNFQDVLDSSLNAAVNGAASGAAFGAIGKSFDNFGVGREFGTAGYTGRVGAHGLVGGVTNEVAGGSFKEGMISASITQAFSPVIEHQDFLGRTPDYRFHRIAFAGVVGGTAAYASGGNVMMGATTGTFSRWFNCEGGKGFIDEVLEAAYEAYMMDQRLGVGTARGGNVDLNTGRDYFDVGGFQKIWWTGYELSHKNEMYKTNQPPRSNRPTQLNRQPF